MKLKVNTDIFKGCLFLIITLIIFLITPSQVSVIEGETINSRSFPYLILCVMGISSVFLMIQGCIGKTKTYWEFDVEEAKKWIVPLAVYGIVQVYVILFSIIGFIFSSLIATTALLLLVKCKEKKYYIISYLCTIIIYFVFTEFLLVPLPAMFL